MSDGNPDGGNAVNVFGENQQTVVTGGDIPVEDTSTVENQENQESVDEELKTDHSVVEDTASHDETERKNDSDRNEQTAQENTESTGVTNDALENTNAAEKDNEISDENRDLESNDTIPEKNPEQASESVEIAQDTGLQNEEVVEKTESDKGNFESEDVQNENDENKNSVADKDEKDNIEAEDDETNKQEKENVEESAFLAVEVADTKNVATQDIEAANEEANETTPEVPVANTEKIIESPLASPANLLDRAQQQDNLGKPEAPPLPNADDKSAVESATARDLFSSHGREEQTQPLSLNWTFGFNRHIGCLNLSDTSRNLVMYVSSHVGVLLDFENNVQKLLLGHSNVITSIDCSNDKRWLVTADKGPNSSVIIWDSYTGIPVQSIFDVPGGKGSIAVAMSPCAKYLITLSASSPQMISVWDWTTSGDEPVCSIEVPSEFGIQTKVSFCPNDDHQFSSNSDSQVIFYSWETGKLEYHAPFLSDDVFNRAVGLFSQTIYQIRGKQAMTGTSQGNIVVWEPERPKAKTALETPPIQKRALKLVRLQDRAITTLTQTNGYIITGDVTGSVKFYDQNLDLMSWHSSKVDMGPVTSVSFRYDLEFNLELLAESNRYPGDATIQGNPFIVRDYTVSTKHAEIFNIHADESSVVQILNEHDAAVHAIAVSPTKPWVCIGSYAGLVKIWNYETKQCVVTRVFEKGNHIQCLAFDKLGLQLAVGMTNGSVHILDAISLTNLNDKPFHYARDAVTHLAFSHNSKYLATADADMATTVFEFAPSDGWRYLGRYKAHYKAIKELIFGITLDSNTPRLLTLAEDRTLVEYDLINSSKDDLRLISIDRIEQSAVPSCIAWYPDVTKESFLVMANDQYKFKLFNTTTKMCRKTLLAPTYGSPIKKILPLPPSESDEKATRLMSYVTKYKVGLQILPLDGNPHRSVAVIAHPSGVSQLAASYDGNYLFTAGGKDSCVHMWSVSGKSLEAAAALGGEGLVPFYGLMEGGRDGELFAELENYFYFAQLRNQGLDTTETREVSTVIPLEQIPFVMRALGFYPSEQEVEDMLNEVKFSEYVETGQYVSEINLGDFIKLYVNHRPAFGLTPNDIEKAFNTLSLQARNNQSGIVRQELFNILQRRGEHMTEQELSRCMAVLLGVSSEGGSTELEKELDGESLTEFINGILPNEITASLFSEEILGLPMSDDV